MSYPPPPPGAPQPPPWNQPSGPERLGTPRWIWGVVALAVVVLVGGGGFLLLGGLGDDDPAPTAGPTAATSAPTSAAPSSSSPTPTPTDEPPCPGFQSEAGPSTPSGWKQVVAQRGLTYDVPADWQVKSCDTLVGWEAPCDEGAFGSCPVRTMSGASSLSAPRCDRGSAALAGVPGARGAKTIDQAVEAETKTVEAIYTSDDGDVPKVTFSEPRRFMVDNADAVQIVATVTGVKTDDCTAPAAIHSMVATTVPGQSDPVMFVISLEQGRDGLPAPDTIDRMVASLRVSPKS